MNTTRRTPEHQRRVVELRRSNAAQPHRSKRAYARTSTRKSIEEQR